MFCTYYPHAASEGGVQEVPAVIYVRLRPLNLGVIEKLGHSAYSIGQDGALVLSLPSRENLNSPASSFQVNGRVFAEDVGTTTIFVEAVQPLVLQATEGISSLVLAYGNSGSGKSHTLFGSLDAPGIVPAAICDLFSHIASYNGKASAFSKPMPTAAGAPAPGASEFSVRMSYVEVRGEQIGDLIRASDGYSPGQRIPTVAPKLGSKRGCRGELEGLKEVELSNLEETISLITKASAYKKARDAVLGSAGAHSIFKLVVEKAFCLPKDESREREKSDTGKSKRQSVTVLKAELTFVEAGGVETLIADPTAGGDRFNRSIFFLTEALLRLAEAPDAIEAFDWDCSSATSLLKGPLLTPGHFVLLATIDPSDRYVPVSVPVLRFSERLSALRRVIRPQTINPRLSHLFTLHREVLQKSEALLFHLSALRKKPLKGMKLKRASEWWAPSPEEQIRVLAELQESLRERQAKILLGGDGDWALLEGTRLSRLSALLQRLSSTRAFLRHVLGTEVPLKEGIPHLASPRPFKPHRDQPSPTRKEVHLRTKEKPTAFMAMVDVSLHLRTCPTDPTDDQINLTSSLFNHHLTYQGGHADDGGILSSKKGAVSNAARGLFRSNDYSESISETPYSLAKAKAPASGLTKAKVWRSSKGNNISLYGGPIALPHHRAGTTAPHCMPKGIPRKGMQAPVNFFQGKEEDDDTEEAWAPFCENSKIEELHIDQTVTSPYEHQIQPWTSDMDLTTSLPVQQETFPATPIAEERVEALDDEESEDHRVYFSLEWNMHAILPSDGAALGRPLGSPIAKAVPEKKRPSYTPVMETLDAHGARLELLQEDTQNEEISSKNGDISEAGHGEGASRAPPQVKSHKEQRSRSTSRDGGHRKEECSTRKTLAEAPLLEGKISLSNRQKEGEAGSEELMKEASALRGEVLSLIRKGSSTHKRVGGPGSNKFSDNGGPLAGALQLISRHTKDKETEESSLEASFVNVPGKGPPSAPTGLDGAPNRQCGANRGPQEDRREGSQGPCTTAFVAPACCACCGHTRACLPFAPPSKEAVTQREVFQANQMGAPTPLWPQVMLVPAGVPMMGPWGPPYLGPSHVCLQHSPPEAFHVSPKWQTTPSGGLAREEEAKRRPPLTLTHSDHDLPHFRASKGGASWMISPPTPSAEAKAASNETPEFCLPEEPARLRRPVETKSDMLLQGTLRPWTRERKRPPGAPRVRVSQSLKQRLGPRTCPGDSRKPLDRETNTDVPAGCCFPGVCQLYPPVGPPRTLNMGPPYVGVPTGPQLCWLQFKGKGTICRQGRESISSSEGPPSSSGSSFPTQREVPVTGAACSYAATAGMSRTYKGETQLGGLPDSTRSARSPLPPLGVEAVLSTPMQGSKELLQQQQHQKHQQQQRYHQRHEEQQCQHQEHQQHPHQEHHQQQERIKGQEHQQERQLQQQQQPEEQQGHHARQPHHYPPPYPHQRQHEEQLKRREMQEGFPCPVATQADAESKGPSPRLSHRTFIQLPNHPIQGHRPSVTPRPLCVAPVNTAPVNPSKGPPAYPIYEEGPLHGNSFELEALPPGAPPNLRGPLPKESKVRHATPVYRTISSPKKPSPSVKGFQEEGTLHRPLYLAEGPQRGGSAFSLSCWGDPALGRPTDFVGCQQIPFAASSPPRIVSLISRTHGGLPTDLQWQKEKTRVIYPPVKPLNMPLAPTDMWAPHDGGGAYFSGPSGAPNMNLTSWATAQWGGAQPGCPRTPPMALGPAQMWAKPTPPTKEMQGGGHLPGTLGLPPQAPCCGTAVTISPQTPQCGMGPKMGTPGSPMWAPEGPRVLASPCVASRSRSQSQAGTQGDFPRGIGEDSEASCFEECLELLNDRVGRTYARRPRLPRQQDKKGPWPFRRR